MAETRYVVIRYGSNAANQSMCNRRVLGTVTVSRGDRKTALELADKYFGKYNNQRFELVPSSKSTNKDFYAAQEADDYNYEIVRKHCNLCGRFIAECAVVEPCQAFCDDCPEVKKMDAERAAQNQRDYENYLAGR